MKWVALFLLVLAIASGCDGTALPVDQGTPAVTCIGCLGAGCGLCDVCRETGAVNVADCGSCEPTSSFTCELPLPACCAVQDCARCP